MPAPRPAPAPRTHRSRSFGTLRAHLRWSTLAPHGEALRSFLSRRVRDEALLEDLVQETMVRAVGSRTAVERLARPRSWLMHVARNVTRDHYRTSGARRARSLDEQVGEHLAAAGDPPGRDAPETLFLVDGRAVPGSHLGGALYEVWERLPPRDRAVVAAHYFEGVSVAEVGARYGAPPGTSKVWLHRARKRLRRLIDARLRSGWEGLDAAPWERAAAGRPRPWEASGS